MDMCPKEKDEFVSQETINKSNLVTEILQSLNVYKSNWNPVYNYVSSPKVIYTIIPSYIGSIQR